MILKAFIKACPLEDSNIYTVRVPFLEDNTNNEALFQATACIMPGIVPNYQVGDCVFVSFENVKKEYMIILGKLYTPLNNEPTAHQSLSKLTVSGVVELPNNTKIGEFTGDDLFNLYQLVGQASQGGSDDDQPDTDIVPSDYVVEQGTSDILIYRKLNSGISECLGFVSASGATIGNSTLYLNGSSGSTNINYAELVSVDWPQGLFSSTCIPIVTATNRDSGSGVGFAEDDGSTHLICKISLGGRTQAIGSGANVHAIGKWKD